MLIDYAKEHKNIPITNGFYVYISYCVLVFQWSLQCYAKIKHIIEHIITVLKIEVTSSFSLDKLFLCDLFTKLVIFRGGGGRNMFLVDYFDVSTP